MSKLELDNYHYHEVTDRAYMIMDNFHEHVKEHIAVLANTELREKANDVVDLMYSFYSLAAIYSEEDFLKDEGKTRAKAYYYEETGDMNET